MNYFKPPFCERVFLLLFLGAFQSFGTPSISTFSPEFGGPGDGVLITGSGFVFGQTTVKFNGVTDTTAAVTSVQPTGQIQAKVPPGATSGFITVTVAGETGFSPREFTVIGAGPYIASFSPIFGNSTVTFKGAHFTGVTAAGVKFNGTNAISAGTATDQSFTAVPPANVTTGPISVTIGGRTFTTSSNYFGSPAIASFSPASGRPGTNVVIKGKNFLGTTSLTLNGISLTPQIDSNTQITVTLPAVVATGRITLFAPGGAFQTSSNFVVLPSLFSFSPYFGKPGTDVTISGINLAGNPIVKFNGATGAIIGTPTAEQIVARVPSSATSGPISVTTTNGTATSSTNFFLPPTIINFNPISGGAGTSVQLTGYNFTNATDVSFNGVSASFSVGNNNLINATVPIGAMTGPISVTTPGGTTNTGSYFAVHPAVLGFDPTIGMAGTLVTIFGSSFDHVSDVLFNGVNAEFTPGNNTQLTAIVPTNATTGPISVVAPAGTGVSAGNFIVDAIRLSIKLLTNGPVVLSWTTNATGFSLQANTNLNSTNSWIAVTNLPVVTGGKNTVTNSPTNSAMFFRLKK
jgi:hypothetical protein